MKEQRVIKEHEVVLPEIKGGRDLIVADVHGDYEVIAGMIAVAKPGDRIFLQVMLLIVMTKTVPKVVQKFFSCLLKMIEILQNPKFICPEEIMKIVYIDFAY